eukprot:10040979-Karenia_brevis.AAC.1
MHWRSTWGVQRKRCNRECGEDYVYGTLEIRRGKTFVVHPYSTDDPIFRALKAEWEWHSGPGKPYLTAGCLRNNT